ncbi:CBS domain-containing protein [Herbiconiux sp. P17]|uniref:CBS domain-containing protein n=1 Tax=Herbiconiux wuyangfengii TaxID=3342794 RepID=UPI0035B82D61
MTKARDIMTADPEVIRESHTLREAAVLMRDLDIGALPILGDDGELVGVITDRDIVVGCVADGTDPESVLVGELADREPVTVEADDDVREALSAMQEHQVRRVPVLEGARLVGIISQADIALSLSATETGETVEEISE